MLDLYPAIFYRERSGGITVVFPDLNHLATEGENMYEAMEMAIDCLAGYIYSLKQDGEFLPEPTPVDQVDIHCEDDEDDDYESSFVSLVAVDVKEYAAKHFEKPVKKTLTVPAWLNKLAMSRKINFSAVLKERLLLLCSAPQSAGSKAEKNFSPTKFNGKAIETFSSEDEKPVKKTLTLPKWLNERALDMNLNFSAVLKDALVEACKKVGNK